MTLIYEGTDMTGYTNVSSCIVTEHSAGAMDVATITLDNASDWSKWKPKEGDEIEISDGDYSTGKMYLRTVKPQDGKYILRAASVPGKADKKAWESYAGMNFASIVYKCARDAGLGWQMHGITGDKVYPYLIRKDSGVLSFLDELCRREGSVLKCYSGIARVISLTDASKRKPAISMLLSANQKGVTYKRDDTKLWKSLTVRSGAVASTAYGKTGKDMEMVLPAGERDTAGRWAKNLLMMHNRETETLTVESGLNTKAVPLTVVDVTGGTEADGRWLIDTAEHDLIERVTIIKMMRVVS